MVVVVVVVVPAPAPAVAAPWTPFIVIAKRSRHNKLNIALRNNNDDAWSWISTRISHRCDFNLYGDDEPGGTRWRCCSIPPFHSSFPSQFQPPETEMIDQMMGMVKVNEWQDIGDGRSLAELRRAGHRRAAPPRARARLWTCPAHLGTRKFPWNKERLYVCVCVCVCVWQ